MVERSVTNSWVMVFSVKPTNGPEKIVHISHCGRLFKLATFIFYIHKVNFDNIDFNFYYLKREARSYRGYSSFKLKLGDTFLSLGVGNMRHERVDSAFFGDADQMILRIENATQEYIVTYLQTIPPKKYRRYPFSEP